jgi:DNA gyrase subunit A
MAAMASRSRTKTPPPGDFTERIVDIDVEQEMRGSYLEYAYSVIYSRALPDARDGLKPVHRRILFQMAEMRLTPDRGHVKSARVVGDVMGRLHPHGDSAIYDALVRLAQPFAMRVPLVDGHGNFGSLGNENPPAAMRYTECRLTRAAMLMTAGLDEDVVDLGPNYDGRETEPQVLPAALPNLLVNGAAGIAVGMATNMPPHNLGEVIAAARHLLAHPDASLDDLMRYVPGPDLPTGGKIVGLDGVREAYEIGRGAFRVRATARIENVTPRKRGIVVTELPYNIGPEKVIEKIKELVTAKRLQGISDLTDLTDMTKGLHLVIEVKNGFHPEAILAELYRLTPMEDSFSINNVCLVDGEPRTLGLRDLLRVYLDHRIEVVRRRSEHRRTRARDRLHLVQGLLVAIVGIDEVIQLIRTSDDAAAARERLMQVFDLSEIQANYILDMPLRRLTRFSRIDLEGERDELQTTITALTELLDDDRLLRKTVGDELADVAKAHTTPRRTVLLEGSAAPPPASAKAGPGQDSLPLRVADDPCLVLLSSTGLLARTTGGDPIPTEGPRAQHDAIVSGVAATACGWVGLVTSTGRVLRLSVLDLPVLPPTASAPSVAGGAPLAEFASLERGERVVALCSLDAGSTDAGASRGLALGTAAGVVKRVVPDYPANRDAFDVIRLAPGDEVIGAAELDGDSTADLVFVASDAQLLRFPAGSVRPQGRAGGGIAGIRLAAGERAVFFGAVRDPAGALVVTVSGSSSALPGTEPGSIKVTPFPEYPPKGRATGGVRAHRFLRGEDTLILAWVGTSPARAAAANGVPVELPPATGKRDGSGAPGSHPVAAVAGPPDTP